MKIVEELEEWKFRQKILFSAEVSVPWSSSSVNVLTSHLRGAAEERAGEPDCSVGGRSAGASRSIGERAAGGDGAHLSAGRTARATVAQPAAQG